MSVFRRQTRSSSSSSSSSSNTLGFEDLTLTPHVAGEATIYPSCTCGFPAALRISGTNNNPGRRFYKCNTCNFFMWLDPESLWYKHVVGVLLAKKATLQLEIEDLKLQLQVKDEQNGSLQDLLDDYFTKDCDQGAELQVLRLNSEEMEKKIKKFQIILVVLMVVIAVMVIM